MPAFINCVRHTKHARFPEVISDGAYPMGETARIWEFVAPITREAGLVLVGMSLEKSDHNTFLNKSFCVYHSDAHVHAVYHHDDNWYIIRTDFESFEKYLKKTGRPDPLLRGLRD